jgi:hypothetical protein
LLKKGIHYNYGRKGFTLLGKIMKNPQVLKIIGSDNDIAIVVSGGDVLHDATEERMAPGHFSGTLVVDVTLYDLTTGAAPSTISSVDLDYLASIDSWVINPITPLVASLLDKHKYVALIVENPGTEDMRDFRLLEFVIDNEGLEATLREMPFEIDGSPLEIRWWDGGSIGAGAIAWKAPVYEGGAGTTAATAVDKITHRGAVVPGP